jgi:hypothetical protein
VEEQRNTCIGLRLTALLLKNEANLNRILNSVELWY